MDSSDPRGPRRMVWPLLATLLALMVAPPVARADDALGRRIYGERCSACHGAGGAGDGPAALALDPKPRNFRDPQFWRQRARAEIRSVVEQGRPGTMMAGFLEVLTPEEIDAVVSYVMHFATAAEGEGHANPGDGQIPGAGKGEDTAGTRPGR